MRRFYYILLSTIAITVVPVSLTTLFLQTLEAQKNYSHNFTANFFACTIKISVPTLLPPASANTFLTSPIPWHQESVLSQESRKNICQEAVTKIQYLDSEPRSSTREEEGEQSSLCIVGLEENETCKINYGEASFEIKTYYNPECISSCQEPPECLAAGRAQGTCSISEPPYKAIWWLW